MGDYALLFGSFFLFGEFLTRIKFDLFSRRKEETSYLIGCTSMEDLSILRLMEQNSNIRAFSNLSFSQVGCLICFDDPRRYDSDEESASSLRSSSVPLMSSNPNSFATPPMPTYLPVVISLSTSSYESHILATATTAANLQQR